MLSIGIWLPAPNAAVLAVPSKHRQARYIKHLAQQHCTLPQTLLMQDIRAVHSISSSYLQLHLQFVLPAGFKVTGSMLPTNGKLQTVSTLSSGIPVRTAGQAVDKHLELPGYLTDPRAEGLLSEER